LAVVAGMNKTNDHIEPKKVNNFISYQFEASGFRQQCLKK